MTIPEFRNAVFYMPSNSVLAMIHLDTENDATNFIDMTVFPNGTENYVKDNPEQKKHA
jgi:hypothetical protein